MAFTFYTDPTVSVHVCLGMDCDLEGSAWCNVEIKLRTDQSDGIMFHCARAETSRPCCLLICYYVSQCNFVRMRCPVGSMQLLAAWQLPHQLASIKVAFQMQSQVCLMRSNSSLVRPLTLPSFTVSSIVYFKRHIGASINTSMAREREKERGRVNDDRGVRQIYAWFLISSLLMTSFWLSAQQNFGRTSRSYRASHGPTSWRKLWLGDPSYNYELDILGIYSFLFLKLTNLLRVTSPGFLTAEQNAIVF